MADDRGAVQFADQHMQVNTKIKEMASKTKVYGPVKVTDFSKCYSTCMKNLTATEKKTVTDLSPIEVLQV